jgi:chromosome segregation ATPase
MNRFLQYANLIGVAALAVLCVIQWSANRRVNLEASALEKTRLDLTAKVAEHEKTIKGQAADLDTFREQLTLATTSLKETENKLTKAGREIARLEAEREQLKASVTNWAAAVTARDERIKEANDRLKQLGEQLNVSIRKFNELAETHGKLVKDWNDQQAKLAAMKTNSAKAASP